MPLSLHCAELEPIAALLVEEMELISEMRSQGAEPPADAVACTMAAGLAQMALAIKPLQLEALDLEMEAACLRA